MRARAYGRGPRGGGTQDFDLDPLPKICSSGLVRTALLLSQEINQRSSTGGLRPLEGLGHFILV